MRRSFGLWLIALFAVSIFAPLAILSAALATYFNRMFIRETENMFANTLSSVSQHITTYHQQRLHTHKFRKHQDDGSF